MVSFIGDGPISWFTLIARIAILCHGLRTAKVLEHRLLLLPQLPRELNMSQM
jgi:hypothetical protein